MTAFAVCWRAGAIAVVIIGALMMVPKPAPAEMPPALYKMGLPAAAGAVAVTVRSAEVSPDQQDGQALQLVVRYSVKNVSFDPVPVAALPPVRLLDPKGGFHDAAEVRAEPLPGDLGSGDPAAGALDPGAQVGRMAVFKVAKDGFDLATWRLLVGGTRGPRVTLQ
ncbi:MAG TPA: hypothetical protein VGH25_01580 [Dongiaceae bacterium]